RPARVETHAATPGETAVNPLAWQSRNIHTHTLMVSLIPALLLGLVLIAYFTHTRLQDLREERDAMGQLIADQLAPATEFGVITGNALVLESLLQGSLDTPYLRAVEVYDHN